MHEDTNTTVLVFMISVFSDYSVSSVSIPLNGASK